MSNDSGSDGGETGKPNTGIDTLREQKIALIAAEKLIEEKTTETANLLETAIAEANQSVDLDYAAIAKHFADTTDTVQTELDDLKSTIPGNLLSTLPFQIYVWSIRIIWITSLSVIAYLAWRFFSITAAYPIITILVLGAILNEVFIASRRRKETENREGYAKKITTLKGQVKKSVDDLPRNRRSFSGLSQLVSSLLAGAKQAITTTALLIPLFDKILSAESIFLKQRHFIDNFRYALTRYNYGDTRKVDLNLRETPDASDNEDVWLDYLGALVNCQFKTSVDIVKLIYYESMNMQADCDAIWLDLKKDRATLNELSLLLIDHKIVLVPENSKNASVVITNLLLRVDNFKLGTIQRHANFFFDELQRFKNDCSQTVRTYKLSRSFDEASVMESVPISPTPEAWTDEIIAKMAELVGVVSVFLKLLVSESRGDSLTNERTLADIISGRQVADLSALLINGRIIVGLSDFQTVAVQQLSLLIDSRPSKFSSADLETDLIKLQGEILRVRGDVMLVRKNYSLKISDRFGFDFVPTNRNFVKQQMIETASVVSKCELRVFNLLYSSATGGEDSEDLFRSLKSDEADLAVLSNVLLENNSIKSPVDKNQLSLLLSMQDSFDLNGIVVQMEHYRRLESIAKSLLAFLLLNKVAVLEGIITFQEIVKICPPQDQPDFAEDMKKLCVNFIVKELDGKKLSVGEHDELSVSASTLFLVIRGDPNAGRMCIQSSYLRLGSRILYQYSSITTKSGFNLIEPTLRAATAAAIEQKDDELYYESFVASLRGGNMYLRISSLGSYLIDQVSKGFEKFQRSGLNAEAMFENLRASVRDALDKEVKEPIAEDLLLAQVVSAYLVTVPGIKAGLTAVVDRLAEAAQVVEIETKDRRYHNIIMLSTGAGNRTRIGLVPFGMTFAEFSQRFQTVFKRANELYDPANYYSSFLIRVFPSEDAMKVVSSGLGEKSPVSTVIELMEEKQSSSDIIKVVSASKSARSGEIKIRDVFLDIIDSEKGDLVALCGKALDPLRDKFPRFTDLRHRELDGRLLGLYGMPRLSMLASFLASRVNLGNEEAARTEFRARLEEAVPKRLGLDVNGLDFLTQVIYDSLKKLGTFLAI